MAETYAHTSPQYPHDPRHWEPLYRGEAGCSNGGDPGHLELVARLASTFAGAMLPPGPLRDLAVPLAHLSGLWHDLGKYSEEFQNYLRSTSGADGDPHRGEIQGRVDHSTAGAQHAAETILGYGALLAYVIAGHHAGLADGLDTTGSCLKARLAKDVPPWRPGAPPPVLEPGTIPENTLPGDPFAVAFFTRMLFSCLVDADFLATEGFMSPERAEQRPQGRVDFGVLDSHLADYMRRRFGSPAGRVDEARADVLAACRVAAEARPGHYSLTVPTGGGKTLASLVFALRHAARTGLARVIYAIPYTSIIEQTASEFRRAFEGFAIDPEDLILEHHTNFDPRNETTRSRLTAENWDAPLVVTTNVQLFESLFANRPSRCRKIHRIARSVIILDEAQTLPVTLLTPTLRALQVLVEQYGCTVVSCTATQPAIEHREEFPIGLPASTPIIPDAPRLYRRLRRVEVKNAGRLGCTELAARLRESEQALAIVNTRRHAADLYASLGDDDGDGSFHLSAAMTPDHRSELLEVIRRRLREGSPCRVVATQLIEAGVDVDFPVVWRALAGLDSIAQAAGRCNREGRWKQACTWVFEPDPDEHPIPRGTLRRTAEAGAQVMAMGRFDDFLGLDAIEHYFRLHYWQQQDKWDREQILDQFHVLNDRGLPFQFSFATTAARYRFIRDDQRPVIVARGESAERLIAELRAAEVIGHPPKQTVVKGLQRHTVGVREHAWREALGAGHLELVHERFAVLVAPQLHYDEALGLRLDADPLYDPNETIV